MDASVGVVAVEVEQFADQRLTLAGRQLFRPVCPQRQDQRPPLRGLGVEEDGVHCLLPLGGRRLGVGVDPVEFSDNVLRIGPQGLQPVDDEAAQPGVGTVPQQRPDFLGFVPVRTKATAALA